MSDLMHGLEKFMDALDREIGSPPPGPERNRRLRAALQKKLDAEKGKGARAFLQAMLDNIPAPTDTTPSVEYPHVAGITVRHPSK